MFLTINGIVKIVGEDVISRNLEFPEIGAIVGIPTTIDVILYWKEVENKPSDEELKEIK